MESSQRQQHPAAPGLDDAARVGELVSETLGPAGAPFVLLPGVGGGQVVVSASGRAAVAGRRLRRLARSPGVLALLERSAAAMDLCGGGATTVLTMLEGAVRRIQAECRPAGQSFASLQRVGVALAEHEGWVRRGVVVPAMCKLECVQPSTDFWALAAAVLRTAIAGKVGSR